MQNWCSLNTTVISVFCVSVSKYSTVLIIGQYFRAAATGPGVSNSVTVSVSPFLYLQGVAAVTESRSRLEEHCISNCSIDQYIRYYTVGQLIK